MALQNRFEERVAEAEQSLAELDLKREAQMKLIRHEIQKESEANLTRKLEEASESTKQRLSALRFKTHKAIVND
jgi:hypothetical protein